MKYKLVYKMLIALALATGATPSAIYAKGWEALRNEKAQAHRVVTTSELEIKAARGIIYVNTSKNVNIKIYTILGSRIADDNLSAGSYQFIVPTHGVYIIKAGDLTCKVAV